MEAVTVTVEKIGLEDFYLGSGTFSRTTSSGSVQTMTKINTSAADLLKLISLTPSANDINTILGMAARGVGGLLVKGDTVIETITAVAVGKYLKSKGLLTLPAYEYLALKDTGVHIYTASLDADEDLVVSSGFAPSLVIMVGSFITSSGDISLSLGTDNGTSKEVMLFTTAGKGETHSTDYSIYFGATSTKGYISAIGSSNYTITIDHLDTGAPHAALLAIAIP